MKVDGKPYRTIWLGADGTTGRGHRPDPGCRTPSVVRDLATVEDRRARHPHHDRARRAADRRHRRLRRGARHGGRSVGRHAGARPRRCCCASAAHGGQPALGARRSARACCGRCRRHERARGRLPARRRDLRRGRRDLPRASARTASAHRASAARKQPRRARQRAHPLQRRLARHRRLGHGDWRRSTRRTTPAFRSMSGSTRRGRATRAPA